MSEQRPTPGNAESGWNQPTAGWPPAGQPQYADQGDPPGAAPGYTGAPTMLPRRGRPGLIVLISVLVEIALVAAAGNQALTRHIQSYASKNQDSFLGQAAEASLTYSWRLSPDGNDTMHIWLASTLGLLSVFVLTGLLMLTVLRGPITFTRAWFGTWMAVIVATGLGGVVGHAIYAGSGPGQGGDRVTHAIFFATNNYTFAAALGLGLIVGLVAGLVAVVSRRPAEAVAVPVAGPPPGEGFFAPQSPPPSFDAPAPPAERLAPSLQKDSSSAQTTAELPVTGDAQQTTQFPRFGIADSGPATSPTSTSGDAGARSDTGGTESATQADSRQTTQLPRFGEGGAAGRFPRPPDDEDLGHQPD